ncbi:MAG: C40 family peptidase [Gemmatimonadaceae bacterium]|nr:C40 family peptidase [Gemmatimonadaceae bacterium]
MNRPLPNRPRRSVLLASAPVAFVIMTGCTQAMAMRSATDILSSVILSGVTRGSSSTESSSSRGGRRGDYPTSEATATSTSRRVMSSAEQLIGVPYTWGGNSPESGLDCSGFVRHVYVQQGIRLPRTSREQADAGEPVARTFTALKQGDLMLFAEEGEGISHVAIYAGDGRFIHSSSSGRGVRYDDLDSQRGEWYATHMVTARRLIRDGRSLVQPLSMLARQGLPFDPPDHAPPPR